MTVILMTQTPAGRRAVALSRADAEALVADGKAVQDPVHGGIYEEVTDAERDQGYLTRNLMPLPIAKRRGRPPKVRDDEAE
jgi:hypothetical protein